MADIVKMFRQIKVHAADTDLQRILWRVNPANPVEDFQLTTVTYDTASAPYLAIRVLQPLADDGEFIFPLGAAALRHHIYVDDILAGADTLGEAETVRLLASAGFKLDRWAASHPTLCSGESSGEKLISSTDCVGALGILWAPHDDTLRLRAVPALASRKEATKRSVLSDVARLFDPAGWAAPVLITAKILLQDIWLAGIQWDDPLPEALRERWRKYAATLAGLNQVRIPRWTGTVNKLALSLHGFADASERAYAAAVYVTGAGPSGTIAARLLVAKTKVAPLKKTSIPRLELCGALLAVRLLDRVASELQIPETRIHAWTDARVVLAWVRQHPSRWQTFVAHRVAAVQELVPSSRWRYVPIRDNPADQRTFF